MKYTICIPVYNMQRTIEASVQSALAQTHSDFEVLLLDNCSTDGTYEKASAISHSRLTCMRNERNLGAYGNHNRCLELARGEWIKFLHGDDELLPGCLARFDHHLRECPPQTRLLACGAIHYGSDEKESYRTIVPPRLFVTRPAHLRDFVLAGNVVGTPTMTLIHKDSLKHNGGFDISTEPGADGDAWLMLRQKFGCAFLPEHLVMTRDDPPAKIASRVRFLNRWINYQIRLVEKWRQHDAAARDIPMRNSVYGRWLVQDVSLAWRAALKYAACGHPGPLLLLTQRIGSEGLLGSAAALWLKRGASLMSEKNFRHQPYWLELSSLEHRYQKHTTCAE